MVKISVIVPVYQVEEYLERCLDSIMSQNFSDFEVICVNDGSQDGSVDILQRFSHHNNIIIIHQENGGLSKARNTGMSVAMGEYFTFVDSDDWIAPDYLSQLYEAAKKTNYKIVKCNICAVYPQHTSDFYQLGTKFYDLNSVLCLQPSAWGALYHHSLWQQLTYPEGLLFEDLATWPLLLQQDKGAYYIDKVLYYYNCMNETSIMNTLNERHLVMDKVFDYILSYANMLDDDIIKLVNFLYIRHVLIYHLANVKYFPQQIRQHYLTKIYHYTIKHFKYYCHYISATQDYLDIYRKKDRLSLKYFLATKGYIYRLKWYYEDKVGRWL